MPQQPENTMLRTPFILIIALSPLHLFQQMFTIVTKLVYFQTLYEHFYNKNGVLSKRFSIVFYQLSRL